MPQERYGNVNISINLGTQHLERDRGSSSYGIDSAECKCDTSGNCTITATGTYQNSEPYLFVIEKDEKTKGCAPAAANFDAINKGWTAQFTCAECEKTYIVFAVEVGSNGSITSSDSMEVPCTCNGPGPQAEGQKEQSEG